jgi:hypothetical protein
VALAATVPVVMHAEAVGGWGDCCCRVCCQPRCCCPTVAVPQTVFQQRDVVATEYRSEPVIETVPSTIYENVMVDEGSYQTVWVPRVTAKTVAKTVYQTRTSYRSVPYQVTRRVSEYSTSPYAASTPLYGYAAPIVAATPITPAASGLVPDPRLSSTPATPITPRSASRLDGGSFSGGSSEIRSADRRGSLFTPAPSAAQVWRTDRDSFLR